MTYIHNATLAVLKEARENGVNSPVDFGDAERLANAALSSISDDDFVAEAQRRVNQGNWSPDRYMSDLQSNDRAKLDKLRSAVIVAKVASVRSGENHPALIELASLCDTLDATTGHKPRQAQAINTTLPGREGEIQS